MRKQGLADHDAVTAAKLYSSGATLAQLGEQFSVSYSAVRRALIATGVVMRTRAGSKPRTDMGGILSSGQGEVAAATVVGAAASLTG